VLQVQHLEEGGLPSWYVEQERSWEVVVHQAYHPSLVALEGLGQEEASVHDREDQEELVGRHHFQVVG